MINPVRAPACLLDQFPSRRSLKIIIGFVDVATRKLPDPPINREPMPSQHENLVMIIESCDDNGLG